MVAEILKRPAVSLDDNLVHLGASSLELIGAGEPHRGFGRRTPAADGACPRRPPAGSGGAGAGADAAGHGAARRPVAGTAALRAYIARTALADPVARRLFKSRPRPVSNENAGPSARMLNRPPQRQDAAGAISTLVRWPPMSSQRCLRRSAATMRMPRRGGSMPRPAGSTRSKLPAIPPGGIEGLQSGYRYDPETHALSSCAAPDRFADLAHLSSGSRETLAASRLVLCFVLSLERSRRSTMPRASATGSSKVSDLAVLNSIPSANPSAFARSVTCRSTSWAAASPSRRTASACTPWPPARWTRRRARLGFPRQPPISRT